ncbi:MAG: hypothetical protein Edafosvirus9_7 [Edafosvirus sp.]|uniref:Uncharacterized protein n=1 Tax=Edafosvirus sp. TaxID=2487765 RepID=A0A3G4ZXH7_9VIRU|nr:MAG: hypothetical protein Edafosvirus9_7 [Edafosvirus sp.]
MNNKNKQNIKNAIYNNSIVIITQLLNSNTNFNLTFHEYNYMTNSNNHTTTPLIYAISNGKFEITKKMILSGKCDLYLPNGEGDIPLMVAMKKCNDMILQMSSQELLEKCQEIVNLLYDMANYDILYQNKYGYSILTFSIFHNNESIFNKLMKDIDKCKFYEKNGSNPILIAINRKMYGYIDKLLDKYLDICDLEFLESKSMNAISYLHETKLINKLWNFYFNELNNIIKHNENHILAQCFKCDIADRNVLFIITQYIY